MASRNATDLPEYTAIRVKTSDRDAVGCFAKAKAGGEQTFTLRAQDATAPKVICLWIAENIDTAPPGKLHEALDDALAMRAHTPRKMPD